MRIGELFRRSRGDGLRRVTEGLPGRGSSFPREAPGSPAQLPAPPTAAERWLRPQPSLGRSEMVTPEEAAAKMGRSVAEIECLVLAGVMEGAVFEGEVVKVRPILLSGPRIV